MNEILVGLINRKESGFNKGWTRLSNFPGSVSASALVTVGDYIYSVFGLISSGSQASNSVYRLHVPTNVWELVETTNPPEARREHSACVIDNKIYVYGGNDNNNQSLSNCYCLDLDTMIWEFETIGESSHSHKAVSYNGNMIVVGGFGPLQTQVIRIYNPLLKEWTYPEGHSFTVYRHDIALSEGVIWIDGGYLSNARRLRSYSIDDNVLTAYEDHDTGRYLHSLEFVKGVGYVYGGNISNSSVARRFEKFTTADNRELVGGAPENRQSLSSSTWNDTIIYVGGRTEQLMSNEAWLFKP